MRFALSLSTKYAPSSGPKGELSTMHRHIQLTSMEWIDTALLERGVLPSVKRPSAQMPRSLARPQGA